MRLRATCHACRKDFLFFELYTAGSWERDRCPRCQVHLGIPELGTVVRTADEATAALLEVLETLSARRSTFTIHAEPWIPQIVEATRRTALRETEPPVLDRPRRRRRQAA